jgi:hypothetical protein
MHQASKRFGAGLLLGYILAAFRTTQAGKRGIHRVRSYCALRNEKRRKRHLSLLSPRAELHTNYHAAWEKARIKETNVTKGGMRPPFEPETKEVQQVTLF